MPAIPAIPAWAGQKVCVWRGWQGWAPIRRGWIPCLGGDGGEQAGNKAGMKPAVASALTRKDRDGGGGGDAFRPSSGQAPIEITLGGNECRPSTWALRDYGPSITGQTSLARNHDPADQGEHSNDPVTGQHSNVGPKPPDRNPGELPPLDRQTMF